MSPVPKRFGTGEQYTVLRVGILREIPRANFRDGATGDAAARTRRRRACFGSGRETVSSRRQDGHGDFGCGHGAPLLLGSGPWKVSTGACAFRAQSSAHAALCATHSKDPAWVHPASSKIGRYASIGQPDEPLPWTTVEPFAAPSTYGVATSVRQ